MNDTKLYAPTTEMLQDLLFQQIERPKGSYFVKIINVYENRYRINIWSKISENGFEKTKITSSYFAVYKSDGTLYLK